jgi:hypothetical protein
MNMARFRNETKSTVVDAIQWAGDNRIDIREFCEEASFLFNPPDTWSLDIPSIDGKSWIRVALGDWIIKESNGDFYICPEDLFDVTYIPLE